MGRGGKKPNKSEKFEGSVCTPVDELKRRETFIKPSRACECAPARGGDAERKSSPEAGCVIKREWIAWGKIGMSVGGY